VILLISNRPQSYPPRLAHPNPFLKLPWFFGKISLTDRRFIFFYLINPSDISFFWWEHRCQKHRYNFYIILYTYRIGRNTQYIDIIIISRCFCLFFWSTQTCPDPFNFIGGNTGPAPEPQIKIPLAPSTATVSANFMEISVKSSSLSYSLAPKSRYSYCCDSSPFFYFLFQPETSMIRSYVNHLYNILPSMPNILLSGHSFNYEIERKSIRSLRLRLISQHSFIISCHYLTPNFIITKFINDHSAWIVKNSSKIQTKKSLSSLDKLSILGVDYQLIIAKSAHDSVVIYDSQHSDFH